MVLAAPESLAAMRARSKFGIAMAAMIRMIATTISNSISEKPSCLRMQEFLLTFRLQCPSPLFAGLNVSSPFSILGTEIALGLRDAWYECT
jgi:hypothetical protein